MNANRRRAAQMVARIRRQPGWRVRCTDSHTVIYPPDGAPIMTLPGTPSDHRWHRNAITALRQRGWPRDEPL